MKNLVNSLYYLICLWFVGGLVGIFKASREVYALSILTNRPDFYVPAIIIYFVKIIAIATIVYHLYKFSSVVNKLTLENFLSKKNGISFNLLGRILKYYCLLRFTILIVEVSLSDSYKEFSNFSFNDTINSIIILAITSLFLLMISKLVDKGYKIQIENDLTI